jgi:hypothetical protein
MKDNTKPINSLLKILTYIIFIYLFINITNFNKNQSYRKFFSHTENQLLMLIILIIIAFVNKHISVLAFILFVIQYKLAYK